MLLKMPQEFHVLRCFSCETFQVHIVKKDRKWECKMCGTKQSLKRNYGRGSAKDCRNHVMKLNELRLTKGNSSGQNEDEIFDESSTNCLEEQPVKEMKEIKEIKEGKKAVKSKWDEYLEDNASDSKSDTDDDVLDFFLATEQNKKRPKEPTKEYYPKSKKICMESSINEVFSEPNKEPILLSSSVEKQLNYKKSAIKIDNKLQNSKYAKYVDEEEVEDKLIKENECLNIFESEPTDLDSLLKLE